MPWGVCPISGATDLAQLWFAAVTIPKGMAGYGIICAVVLAWLGYCRRWGKGLPVEYAKAWTWVCTLEFELHA